jgi:RNA polymerase sigma factor (sigma-70 family)
VTAAAEAPVDEAVPTDADLIALSLREPERFAAVFDRHGGEIYRYVAARLGPDVADDVAAETFLTAFRKRDRYDLSRDEASPWLYGIATRSISEHRRAERRRLRALGRAPAPNPPEPFEEATEDRVAAERMRPQLAGILAGLSAEERDLLLLVAWTDLTYDGIAQALGVATGTVASRLHRIRKKINGALSRQWPAAGPTPRSDFHG